MKAAEMANEIAMKMAIWLNNHTMAANRREMKMTQKKI